MDTKDITSGWEPFKLFVVRSTGFSFTLLESLRSEALLTQAHILAAAQATIARLQERFFTAVAEADRPSTLEDTYRARALLGSVRRRRELAEKEGQWAEAQLALPNWTEEWNASIRAMRSSAAALPTLYARTREQARAAVRALLSEPRVQEALYLLTPAILDHAVRHLLERPPTTNTPNQDERKIITFLQRLCAKCETNAFIGPIAYGTISEAYPAFVGDPYRHERKGFVAHWIVRELAMSLLRQRDSIERICPRRGPAADFVELPEAFRRLLSGVEGLSTWSEIAKRVAAPLPSRSAVELFEKNGLAWSAIPVPASEPDALLALEKTLDNEEKECASVHLVQRLRALTNDFASGGLERKKRALQQAEQLLQTQGISRLERGAGEMYVDRVVFYEEDYEGMGSRQLTREATRVLREALTPVLDLAAASACSVLEQVREQTRQDFLRAFPGQEAVSLPAFLKHIPLTRPADIADSSVIQALKRLLLSAWDGRAREVNLDQEEVKRALAPFTPSGEHILLASPDVMVSASSRAALEKGEIDVIVGEIHWGLQLFGNLCCFIENRQKLLEEVRAWLSHAPASPALLNVALGNRFGKMCFLEVAPRTLELSGPASTGSLALHPSELSVTASGQLRIAATGEAVTLLSGDPEGRLHTPLAPPALRLPIIRLGDMTPRIRIGRAIVQRATWWASAQDFHVIQQLPAAEQYLALVSWFQHRGIAERVFVRLEHEPKPFYVDLASPHLADMLIRTVRSGEIRLTEMLPAPNAVWQENRPCEFRLAFVKQA